MQGDVPPLSLVTVNNDILNPYFDMAAVALLLYDHLLTLDLEIFFVWAAPWNPSTILYLMTAYMGFIECGLLVFVDHTGGVASSPLVCSRVYKARVFLLANGMALAEFVLVRRTWAIYGRSRKIGISLGVFWAMTVVVAVVLLIIGLEEVQYIPRPIPGSINCLPFKAASSIIFVEFILLVIIESVILALTLHKARGTFRTWRSSTLTATLYRDGILYYVYLLAFSVLNIVAVAVFRTTLLILLQRMLHAVLIKRILLNLRSFHDQSLKTFNSYRMSSLVRTDPYQQEQPNASSTVKHHPES